MMGPIYSPIVHQAGCSLKVNPQQANVSISLKWVCFERTTGWMCIILLITGLLST